MTPEQLDEIEKLVEATSPAPWDGSYEAIALREYTRGMVKAVREAWAALEWQAEMTKALSESQERLAQEVKEARAEVARLQEHVDWLLAGREQQEQRLALEVD